MHFRRGRTQSSSWKKLCFFFSKGSKNHPPKKPKTPWWRRLLNFLLVSGLLVLGSCFVYGVYFLPSVEDATQLQFEESTIIYDRAALDPTENPLDHVLYVIHGDENREYIPLKEISPWVKKATIAIEDDGFYDHIGFDVGGIIKAALNKFFGIGSARGGSTITQQLVKNSFLSRERTLTRKFNEILLSLKIEWAYEKDEILEMYLNKIPYGNNAHGVEAAAKTFFGKSARDLTLAEASILASLPVAPTRFSPYGANKNLLLGFYEEDPNTGEKVYKKGRKDLVLQRMLDLGFIAFEEFEIAWSESKEVEFKSFRTDIKAPHFVFHVREQLEEKYGKEFLRQGGLRIYTTLDPEMQTLAEKAIEEKTIYHASTHNAKNAALAAINPQNGEILAFVGGKDYFDSENDGQVNILTSRRQPGSSFKPFVYAAAFEKGYSPSTVLFDVETDFGGNYQPQNFDGKFTGPIPARDALNRSLNIPAIKMAFLATPQSVLDLAKKVGIKYEGDADFHGIAIGIGVAEVEPLSHINAYQVFAGNGSWYEPSGILEIQNSEGMVLESFDPEKNKHEGLAPEIAALVRDILTDETTRPTIDEFDWNKYLQIGTWDNGAKTGTSNRKAENPDFNEEEEEDEEDNPKMITVPGDSWTVGFSPYLVTGVWIGNNKGEPMKSGATGMTVAAPVWRQFMLQAHDLLEKKGADPKKPYPEVALEKTKVNKFSGKLATDKTPEKVVREEVFAPFAVPTQEDNSIQLTEIDRFTGRPATRFTPRFAREEVYRLDLKSIRPDIPNWQQPVEDWIEDHPMFMESLGEVMDPDPDEDEEGEEGDEEKLRLRKERRESLSPYSYLSRDRRTSLNELYFNRSRNAPQISITSPKDNGKLSPGEVDITVSVNAKNGVIGVEYYFDDVLVADSDQYPWKGHFYLPESAKIGTTHSIKAVAIDQLHNIGEQAIKINIGGDYDGPEIVFLGPRGNERMSINSTVHILADIKDYESRVSKVQFWLDNEMLTELAAPPFQHFFVAKGKMGRHNLMIRAWDGHENMSEKSIPISYEREMLVQESQPGITKITSFRNTISIDLLFPTPEKIEWAEVVVIQGGMVPFQQKIMVEGKSAQVHVAKNKMGEAEIKLFTKFTGIEDVIESDVRKVDL